MAITKSHYALLLMAFLLGCGSKDSLPAATPSEAPQKGPAVTKPSGERMDQTSEEQATNEELGG